MSYAACTCMSLSVEHRGRTATLVAFLGSAQGKSRAEESGDDWTDDAKTRQRKKTYSWFFDCGSNDLLFPVRRSGKRGLGLGVLRVRFVPRTAVSPYPISRQMRGVKDVILQTD
jgi:hypothetical protein